MVSIETPPMMSKPPIYHHPYHPEVWAPESPILLLLSRFSHAPDPSTALINTSVFSGLLYYLTQHHDPSGRCFRMLGRLSCNPNCLQALVRTGAVALIRQKLCVRGDETGGTDRQSEKVKGKITQLGLGLLSNLRVQSESGFGTGVLTHIMLSGSESDKLYCVLSLPLVNSNRALLKKLLLDSGGLAAALELIGCHSEDDDDDNEDGQSDKCRTFLAGWLPPQEKVSSLRFKSLYASLLIGCLSSLLSSFKEDRKNCSIDCRTTMETNQILHNKSQLQQIQPCPYQKATHNLTFLLDNGALLQARHEAVTGEEEDRGVGSEYFRALLMGGFGEAQKAKGEAIRIKDVKSGMLLPVLHYLHGCRWIDGNEDGEKSKQDTCCLVLSSLVSSGFVGPQDQSAEREFLKSSLAQVMIGACRFLVPGLQQAAEDLCVGLLYSFIRCLTTFSSLNKTTTMTNEMDDVGSVSKSQGLQQMCKTEAKSSKQQSKCSKLVLSSSSSSSLCSDRDNEGVWLRSLLPQVYWFSQRYSYMQLGQACLSVLLRPQGVCLAPLHPSLSTDCFLRLAQEADCAEGLKQDILNLVKTALS